MRKQNTGFKQIERAVFDRSFIYLVYIYRNDANRSLRRLYMIRGKMMSKVM